MRLPAAPLVRVALALALPLSATHCRPAEPTVGPSDAAPPVEAGPVEPGDPILAHSVRIFDAQGREHTLGSMLDELAKHRVVLLGETHLDDVTHQVELAVLEGLADRHDDRVVLTMEMFERDVQAVLDDYLAGRIEESELLAKARPWGNYRTDYRPLVETARARRLPVVAANTPRPALRTAARGAEGFAKAKAEHPDWLPQQVFPASKEYWARVDRAIRGHGPPSGGDRTYDVQNLWDNTMAESIVKATQAHPEHRVLHVVGGFHVEQHDGTAAQIHRRAPDLDVVTIEVTPSSDLARVKAAPERADFVVYAQAIAEGPSGDQLAVTVPGSLAYRLHLPEGTPPSGGWPLLVWLADDDERPEDAVLRWRMAVGDGAAVAVVVPPRRTLAREGWEVRRWSWPDSQHADFGEASFGIARILDYARRRLPVRGDSVLVAGEGAGGTVALWSAQFGDDDGWKGVHVLALAPALPRALRTASIPERPSSVAAVDVRGELDDGTRHGLEGAGLQPTVSEAPTFGGARDAAVRAALDLVPREPVAAEPGDTDPAAPMASWGAPFDVRVTEGSAVARRWAALYVDALRGRGHDAVLVLPGDAGRKAMAVLDFDARPEAQNELLLAMLAGPRALPSPPDPFGGAVVLLVPRKVPRAVLERWNEILAQVEGAQGVFKTPYRVVQEGSPELPGLLAQLREQGRTEVLVVPAELCASRARMQGYLDAVEPLADGLTLHWLPGLGHHVVAAIVGTP